MTQPYIYSYSRISSKKQQRGRGLEIQRERESIERLKQEFGLQESPIVLSDSGKSAFHGLHVKDGKLGWFLKAVENGDVAPGSILVVQGFDRFSREDIISATNQLTNITARGVMIYSAMEQIHLGHPDDGNQTRADKLKEAMGAFTRAYSESQAKSYRVNELTELAIAEFKQGVRDEKNGRVKAIKVVGNDVWWIDNSDGTIRKRDGYFQLAKEIIERRTRGESVHKLCQWLNDIDRPGYLPCPTNRSDKRGAKGRWAREIVHRMSEPRRSKVEGSSVTARPILGEKLIRDEVLVGYYPALVTEEQYYALMDTVKNRARPKRHDCRGESLLSGINVYCAHCNSRVTRTMETGGILNYRCGHSTCDSHWSKRGELLESALLKTCIDKVWRPERKKNYLDPCRVIEGELAIVNEKIKELERDLSEEGYSKVLARAVRDLEAKEQTLRGKLEEAKTLNAVTLRSQPTELAERWKQVTDDTLDMNNDLGRRNVRELIYQSCEYIKIGRPSVDAVCDDDLPEKRRFILDIDIKFKDGVHRFIRLGAKSIIHVSGTDFVSVKGRTAERLSDIEADNNMYQYEQYMDSGWLENEFSSFNPDEE
ncbi:recombinase family protein [Vibrio cholerae]|nr:recombinase family protein [Vibrio cholerae]ELH0869325.1 recombinase family protein [Vibrio cholerae]ELJ8383992.1 recombinase family protein [Vibrio cholerae]